MAWVFTICAISIGVIIWIIIIIVYAVAIDRTKDNSYHYN